MEAILLTHFILVISAIVGSINAFDNSIKDAALPVCKDLIKSATARSIRAPVPLSLAHLRGTWVSESCETRPGPEYVTRKYWFSSDGKMFLQLHFYEDSSCRIPSHLIKAEGHLNLETKSYVTPGGTEADYSFDRINIKAYTAKASKKLALKMTKLRSCNVEAMLKKLKPGIEVLLYQSPWNGNQTSATTGDCWEYISWSELQLIRLETDTEKPTAKVDGIVGCSRKELFFGDLHTDLRYQKAYRPTAYQTPLIQDNCQVDCNGCKKAGKMAERIYKQTSVPMVAQDITGYWASARCEVQRYGLFLTRILHFSSAKSTWNLKQKYYYDPTCAKPMYTILAGGTAKAVNNNTNIPAEIDMRITRMSIIPEHKQFVAQLNRLPMGLCGKADRWNIGKRRDITVTGGCSPLGLLVPSKEPEIYKIVLGVTPTATSSGPYLHLGQTPTWVRKRNRAPVRPTSWGPALGKCRKHASPAEDNRIRPVANARTALDQSGAAVRQAGSSRWVYVALLLLAYLRNVDAV